MDAPNHCFSATTRAQCKFCVYVYIFFLFSRIQVDTMENSDSQQMNGKMMDEMNALKARLEEAELNEGELTEQNLGMQDELESMHKRCTILQQELDLTEEELEAAHRKCSHLEQEVELSNEKCTSTERELQLACLSLEKLKLGQKDDFNSAEVLQRDTEEKRVLQIEVKQLKEALEVKDSEIEALRQSNREYQNDEEDLTYLKEHIEMQEQEIEDLSLKVWYYIYFVSAVQHFVTFTLFPFYLFPCIFDDQYICGHFYKGFIY